jgi:hypothetical protein
MAFCRIPVAPEDWPFLCVLYDNGSVQIDHVACFSCSGCPGIFGQVANVIVAIYQHYSVEDVLKWVDDFVFF